MRILVTLVLIFLQMSCSSHLDARDDKSDISTEKKLSNLEESLSCFSIWGNVINDWKKNGGGIKESLIETRKQIAGDDKSLFSKIVKKSWERQNKDGFHETFNSFGYWDVSSDNYRNATFIFSEVDSKVVPEHCLVISWVTSVFWDELRRMNKSTTEPFKLKEVEGSIIWDSPTAQNWVTYWLFVNVNLAKG